MKSHNELLHSDDMMNKECSIPKRYASWITWDRAKASHLMISEYKHNRNNYTACGLSFKDQKGLRPTDITSLMCEACLNSKTQCTIGTLDDIPKWQKKKLEQDRLRKKFKWDTEGLSF